MTLKENNAPMTTNISDLLFGDVPLETWALTDCNETPWDLFKLAKANIDEGNVSVAVNTLKTIAALPNLESRQYLQAHHALRQLGIVEETPIIYGVIAEVGLDGGHDTVAVYADYAARYYNYSGNGVVWEHPDASLDNITDHILMLAEDLITKIGPWKGDRRPAPTENIARINILTSNGLYFGEAPIEVLFSDPMAKGIMRSMFDMMQTLITKGN
ncbi:MAG: hypothetical protein ABIN67_21825 [Ferruginibacter sp.]